MAGKSKARGGNGNSLGGGKQHHNNSAKDFKTLIADSDSDEADEDPLVALLSEEGPEIGSAKSKLLLAAALSKTSRSSMM